MRFGLGTLTRVALLSGVVLVGACSSDPVEPGPANPAPTGLTAAANGTTAINLNWTAPSTAATQFVLQRATGATGSFAEIDRPVGTATTYADAGLTAGTQYRYRLAAVRDGETSAYSVEASATTETEQGGGEVLVTTDITANTTWTKDKVYRLVGFRKVANGATLTIQAGTKIVGDYDITGSSLFVLRGARIMAVGNAAEPIVFTSAQPVGQRLAGDWGGLIVIGNGIINRSGVVNIEGTGTSADNPLLPYSGGDNNFDSSGRLSYVRVEYAGFGPAENAELNTFTFAAVGSQTVLDHLQAHNGLDDSFEFFGGAADMRYAVSTEAGDDHFDMSEGYQGRVQYFVAYQSKQVAPRAGAGGVSGDPQGVENDGCAGSGCDAGQNSTPFTIPVLANGTIVMPGAGVVGASGGFGMVLRRGTGGHYVNTVIARGASSAIGYRDATSKERETAGLFSLKGIYIAETPVAFQTGQQTYSGPAGDVELSAATTATSLFTAFSANPSSMTDLNFVPAAGSPIATGGFTAWSGDLSARGAGLDQTTYRGAFAPGGTNWLAGWTEYSDN
ncbi:MAG TPA: fibronectin type III domain-containing protein [Gemmatimonadales bacterium]|nr:fibronectin type III domain-containing protein [Gemmatimonadales bacterium]